MKAFACCCSWRYVVGRKQVYGPIYRCGIGDFPDMLGSSQRMMSRQRWEDEYVILFPARWRA